MTYSATTESPIEKVPSKSEEITAQLQDVENTGSDELVSAPLEKVQSSSKRSDIDPSTQPPDGGLNAWLKVFGCFLIYSNIWGFTLTFGAFQTYYQHTFLSSSSPSAISWIGTIQSWLLIIIGVLSGPLFDLGWYRPMLILGNFLVVFGIFMLSLANNYWQVFLSQGVCMGLGAGLLYVPSLALIGLSFSRKRALAQGITTSGIAVGGVAYIIAFDRISSSIDFGWAVRTMGFIALGIALIAFPSLLYGTGSLAKARTARKLFDPTALRDPIFLLFSCCTFMTFLGYIVPYFYIPSFAQDALGISASFALYILIMGVAASFFGRLAVGIIAHHLGPIFTWLVFWGFCSGGLVTLPAAVFPRLCPDLRRLGTRMGMSWGMSSFASLTGSPIAGALLQSQGGTAQLARTGFLHPQLWSGCTLLAGAGLICVLWVVNIRREKSGIFI
ncbi:MFS general substrate transporter [Rhizodiscina lignyota]|uniref:MFS general substrate transporter n=1 Tax=Rhizodiscina lignyota TaxID=1504668 RepID=A0A9P4M804_9PEZI|nr:MFS general substrate transporter [Rhizodiscina lignyota]